MNPRQKLKWELIDDPSRRVLLGDSKVHVCEGQAYEEHRCKGGIEMNEVLFTRDVIKHLPASKKRYFWHEYNCSLNCTWFHRKHGHTRPFRDWWRMYIDAKYGESEVEMWISRAPVPLRR